VRESEKQKEIWRRLIDGPRGENALRTVMWRMACDLSSMVGRTIGNGDPQVEAVPLSEVAVRAGDLEAEMVGVYLVMQSGLRGQALLILPVTCALCLADLLMDEPLGTATFLGEMERSALAEVGNMAVSSFLNAVATNTGAAELLRPSSPAVMVDMLGAILDVIVTPVAAVRDDLLIIETVLKDAKGNVQARFWMLPDPALRISAN
jgi:chemotaxis protein CheC